MKSVYTILLLICSNIFMTLAWYGHLKLAEMKWFQHLPLIGVILFSWGIAFFEYCLQVPANRMGFLGNGGPFNLMQLKIIQEVVTVCVFIPFMIVFMGEKWRWDYLWALLCMVGAVYFVNRSRL